MRVSNLIALTTSALLASASTKASHKAHFLKLGDTCDSSSECPRGVQCWANSSWSMKTCGNFNAECTKDSQCAYGLRCSTDNGKRGMCSRPPVSSSASVSHAAKSTTKSKLRLARDDATMTNSASDVSAAPSSTESSDSIVVATSTDSVVSSSSTVSVYSIRTHEPIPVKTGHTTKHAHSESHKTLHHKSTTSKHAATSVGKKHFLKAGEICTHTQQCPAGVECFARHPHTTKSCGNIGAQCRHDAQCAHNLTCIKAPKQEVGECRPTPTASASAASSSA